MLKDAKESFHSGADGTIRISKLKMRTAFSVFGNTWTFDLATKDFFQILWETNDGLEIQTLAEHSNLEYSDVVDLIEDLMRHGLIVKV